MPFTIHFHNKDAGTPHNVEIKDAPGRRRCSRATSSPASIVTTYSVPALAAGTYPFVCDVHPNMTGTLKVGA